MASRIAARSTTAGTPVKSCISTRAGMKAISSSGTFAGSQRASFSTSAAVTVAAVFAPQQVLEQDLEGVGQAGDRQAAPLQGVEAEDLEAPAGRGEGGAAAEAVGRHGITCTAVMKYSVSPKQVVGIPCAAGR